MKQRQIFGVGGVLLLTITVTGLLTAEGGTRRGDELLSQRLNINQEGLQATGRVVIRSLSPPHVELFLEEAVGEGPRLVKLISRWMQLPPEMTRDFPIKHLTLRDAHMTYKKEGWVFTARESAIPEGQVQNLSVTHDVDGPWQGSAESLRFTRMPPWPGLPQLGAVAADKIAGNGDGQMAQLRLKSWQGGGLTLEDGHATLSGLDGVGVMPWRWQAGKGVVDLAGAWAWVAKLPQVEKALSEIKGVVEEVQPQGRLLVAATDFRGEYDPSFGVRGVKGVSALALRKGEIALRPKGGGLETILIDKFSARGRGEGESMVLDNLRLSLSGGRGSGEVSGSLYWPPRLEKTRLSLKATALQWAGWQVSGQGGWLGDSVTPLSFSLAGPAGESLLMEGQVGPWRIKKQTGIDIQLASLVAQGMGRDEVAIRQNRPFFKGAVPMPLAPTRLMAKQVVWGKQVTIAALDARHPPEPAVVKESGWGASLSGLWCGENWQSVLWVAGDGSVSLKGLRENPCSSDGTL